MHGIKRIGGIERVQINLRLQSAEDDASLSAWLQHHLIKNKA
jgi:hypothetical protein